MNVPAIPYPKPTAQVAPYVDALGVDLAIAFLLRFGGTEVYIAANPRGGSDLEGVIGPDQIRRFGGA